MKQIFSFTLLLCAFCYNTYCQNQKIADSFLTDLRNSNSLKDSLTVYFSASEYYRKSDSVKAFFYANKALSLSLKSEDKFSIQQAYFHIGKAHDVICQYKKALLNYKKGLEISKSLKDDSLKATFYSRVGYTYGRVGQFDSALVNHFEALKIRQKLNNNMMTAYSYNFIGIIYTKMGIYDEALKYLLNGKDLIKNETHKEVYAFTLINIGFVYKELGNFHKGLKFQLKGLEIREKLNNKFLIAHSYKNIGQCYLDLKDYNEALNFCFKAVGLMEEVKANKGLPIIFNTIGKVYLNTSQYHKAKDFFYKANTYARKLNSVIVIAQSATNLGLVSIKLKNYAEAESLLNEGLKLGMQIKSKSIEKDCYKYFSVLFEEQGRHKKALKYNQLYAVIKDSIFSNRIENNISNLELVTALNNQQDQFEWKQKEEKFINEKKLKEQKRIRDVLLFIVLIIILLAYFIYKNYRNKNKANRLLRRQNLAIQYHQQEIINQNEKLREMNQEKDAIMGIVAHDLKAPLNKIKGLLYLLGMEGDLNEQQNKLVRLTDKILHEGDRLIRDLVDLNSFEHADSKLQITEITLDQFLQHQLKSFDQQLKNKNIKLHLDTDKTKIYSDEGFLSRVLDNLISNAIKYSLYDRNLYVRSWQEQDATFISIRDEGPGISSEDQKKLFQKFQKLSALPTGGESSTGLGLSIVKTLTEKLNGEIIVKSQLNKGSEFIINIPNFISEMSS